MTDDLTDGGVSIMMIRHKVVFVGDVSVGKTSILKRIGEDVFNDCYDPTIGIDFFNKYVNFRDSQIRLQIWDSAGQEKYRSLIPAYLKGSSIIFLVYDIARKETFTNLKKWLSFINENKSENTILVLCGNKSDLERQVSIGEREKLAEQEKIKTFEVSAKTGTNLDSMFYTAIADLSLFDDWDTSNKHVLINELIETNKSSTKPDNPTSNLNKGLIVNNATKTTTSKEGCKC